MKNGDIGDRTGLEVKNRLESIWAGSVPVPETLVLNRLNSDL